MSAVTAAKAVEAMVPPMPKTRLFGVGSTTETVDAVRYYGAMRAASIAAWRYAAAMALNDAIEAAPSEWTIDSDNHAFIERVAGIRSLELMCSPTYPWSGRRLDQI